MQLRYAEARRIHTPSVLTEDDVVHFGQETIDLALLARQYTAGDKLRPGLSAIGQARPLRYGNWRPVFDETAQCVVSRSHDPADDYAVPDDPRLVGCLCLSFNASAVSAMAAVVSKSVPECPPGWTLRSVRVRWLCNCPMADVISVFDVPEEGFTPQLYADTYAALTRVGDDLWPVLFAVLDWIWQTRLRTGAGPDKPEFWDNENWPFGQPRALRALGVPDLDPSQEYQYDAVLLVDAPADEFEPLIAKMRALTKFPHEVNVAEGVHVHVSEWAMVVVHRLPGRPGVPDREHGFNEDDDYVLGVVLAGLVLKLLTYNERVYTAVLTELMLRRLRIRASALRDLVYRAEQLRVRLINRATLLSDAHHKIYDAFAESCRMDEYTARADRLADLVLRAAEGIDADHQQEFEHRAQMFGLFFVCVGALAIVLQWWDVSFGDPAAPDAPRPRFWPVTGVSIVVVLLALVAALFFHRMRGSDGQSGGGWLANAWDQVRDHARRVARRALGKQK